MGYYIGVKFEEGKKYYNFSTELSELLPDDFVVVETIVGLQIGQVTSPAIPLENYHSSLELKPIIRLATSQDFKQLAKNEEEAKIAAEVFRNEVKKQNLGMKFVSAEYTLDASKIVFEYVSEDRVDFRELLKNLAYRLHCRIELRQIGPRDKAKIFGGVGICGLPICCNRFLSEFNGISINRAKNQMLVINIPKLSGQCGKLLCCLKFEDDMYTEEKAKMPDIGTRFKIKEVDHTVVSYNIFSKIVKCSTPNGDVFLPLNDIKKYLNHGK